MNGCTEYYQATVDMWFEENHLCCAMCPILETYSRNQCRRTGEYIIDTRGRGADCPLVIKGKGAYGEVHDG